MEWLELDKTGVVVSDPGDEGNGVRETTESIKKENRPSFHQETNEDEVARVREGLTTDPKKQQSRQRETDEIAEEREDSLPTKENSNNSENSPVDCYKNARSCTRSSPSSTGNRRGDIGSSDSNSEGDNRGQRVSPQPRPDYYKNARSDTRSPASSGQETSAHERPGQPDAKGGSHTPLPPGDFANSNLKVNYRTTWKRHIQLRVLIAKRVKNHNALVNMILDFRTSSGQKIPSLFMYILLIKQFLSYDNKEER